MNSSACFEEWSDIGILPPTWNVSFRLTQWTNCGSPLRNHQTHKRGATLLTSSCASSSIHPQIRRIRARLAIRVSIIRECGASSLDPFGKHGSNRIEEASRLWLTQ